MKPTRVCEGCGSALVKSPKSSYAQYAKQRFCDVACQRLKKASPTFKACPRCDQVLPADRFKAEPRMRHGLSSYCRDCSNDYARERYAANREHMSALNRASAKRRRTPEQTRARHIKAKYGLAVEQYDALLATQGGRCAICHTDTPRGRGVWHVDHCHDTGEVRGLLCSGCNVGLGHFRDDPGRLRAAATYIEQHKEIR